MNETPPSSQEWQALYEAAGEFFRLRPWEWMVDSELFGVLNPETGEIGYCCVMGNLGELLALGVYLGSDGLETYLMMQSGELEEGDEDMLFLQRCLMASFEDRSDLDKADLQAIKGLGLKFRGRQSWPVFRSYRPGYLPWQVTAEEARFLALALQQAVDVAGRLRANPDLLDAPEDDLHLVRVPEQHDGQAVWRERWLTPAPLKEDEPIAVPPPDPLRLAQIKQSSAFYPGTWEVDFFHAPFPITGDGDRPYFPLLFICVDRDSHFILGFDLTKPEDYLPVFQNKFLSFIEEGKRLPKHINVAEEELFDMLLPTATHLGIRLRLVEELDTIDDVREGLTGFMGGGPVDEEFN